MQKCSVVLHKYADDNNSTFSGDNMACGLFFIFKDILYICKTIIHLIIKN